MSKSLVEPNVFLLNFCQLLKGVNVDNEEGHFTQCDGDDEEGDGDGEEGDGDGEEGYLAQCVCRGGKTKVCRTQQCQCPEIY